MEDAIAREKRKERIERVIGSMSSSGSSSGWTRWVDEHGSLSVSEEQVRTCMGIRASRQHASMGSRRRRQHHHRSQRQPRVETSCSDVGPTSPEDGEPSKTCMTDKLQFIPSRQTSRFQGPYLKLQPTLSSLSCILGSPRTIKKGDTDMTGDSLSDLSNDRGLFADESDTENRQLTKNQSNKTVTFLQDMTEETIVEETPRPVQGRRRPRRESQDEKLQRELNELHDQLAELQLLNCLDETELWLGLHDVALKSINLDRLYEETKEEA